jgi:hypothetical protein
MNKLVAVTQLIGSALISIAALAMLVNLIFIATRPETISVINAMIGGGVLVVCLPVIATVLFKKGVAGLKQDKLAESPDTTA